MAISDAERIEQLRLTIQNEEKRFLMDRYVTILLGQVKDEQELDDRTIESLLVSRVYVNDILATTIAQVLTDAGHEVTDEEKEDDDEDGASQSSNGQSSNGHSEEGDAAEDVGTAVEDEDFAAVLDGGDVADEAETTDSADGTSGEEAADPMDAGTMDGDSLDDLDIGDATGLFDNDGNDSGTDSTSASGNGTQTDGEDEFVDATDALSEADASEDSELGDLDGEGLFDEGTDEAEDSSSGGDAPGSDSIEPSEVAEGEVAGDVGLFDEEEGGETESGDGARKSKRESEETEGEEDEEAGVLFDQDIYSGNEDSQNPDDDAIEETPGVESGVGHEVKQTPGFEGGVGHEVEETPGFTPTKGHDVKQTPGFTPTEEHVGQDTPGFTPTKGHDNRRKKAGPGFTVGGEEGSENAAGPVAGLDAASEEATTGKKKATKGEGVAKEGNEKKRRFQSSKERAEQLKKEKEERRARIRQQQQPQEAEEEEEEEADLDSLTHQISLDDIEQYLGMQVLPDDRQNLERRWQQKIRDPSIRQLLSNSKAMEHPYALVPRLPRFFKGGTAVKANMVTLIRNYPQLFDNVAGVINKYRTEDFFVGETPQLDWCIVACEALPSSLNSNYTEQKSFVKQYAQSNQTNERKIQRRRLIEILYDCIVINGITKKPILEKTVDLSDSRVGRQNFACVNYGDKGIRINDVGRQQRHPQMGMCPSW